MGRARIPKNGAVHPEDHSYKEPSSTQLIIR